jgi:DNA polymerase IV
LLESRSMSVSEVAYDVGFSAPSYFTQITRSISQEKILAKKDDILPLAKRLLQLVDYSSSRPIRLLGLSVSNASSEEARKEDKENSTLKPEYRELELEFEEWKE